MKTLPRLSIVLAIIFLLAAPGFIGCKGRAVVPPDTGSNVPRDEAQQALAFHNAKRRDVGAPPLQWSAALAANAQSWANHLANDRDCQLIHQQNNRYGENLFWGGGKVYTALDASQDWYDEIKYYKYGVLTKASIYQNGHDIGHYTQLVWKNSTQVGIGQATCTGGRVMFAAEYYPRGNYIGQKPY